MEKNVLRQKEIRNPIIHQKAEPIWHRSAFCFPLNM